MNRQTNGLWHLSSKLGAVAVNILSKDTHQNFRPFMLGDAAHPLPEVRLRALQNLVFKFTHGLSKQAANVRQLRPQASYKL